MPISELIDRIRSELDVTGFPDLINWKNTHPGGKAIGCFPVYTPVEMVHAAGMLPVLVAGAEGQVKLDEADGYLQSFVCSIVRSTLELKLDGSLDELDGMIFPSVCDMARGLSGIWKRHESVRPVIYIHFPQNNENPSALDYLAAELNRVRKILEEISGTQITDQALNNSFEVYNARAELLEELNQIRIEHPGQLKASDFYILRLAGMAIPPEEHIEILKDALGMLEDTEQVVKPKLRMILIGAFCERPPVAMIETMENEGIAIVADDMLLGQRWWTRPLEPTGDPIKELAKHYITASVYSSVVYNPSNSTCVRFLDTMMESHADGIIMTAAKSCQPALHDHPCLARKCEDHGLPYFKLQFEEDQRVFESTRVQVEALIEARERLPFAGTENGEK